MENTPRILALSDGKPGHFHQTEGILNELRECDAEWARIQFRSKGADNRLRAQALLVGRHTPRRAIPATVETAVTEESFAALMGAIPPDAILSTGSSVAAVNLLMSAYWKAKSVVCTRPSPLGVRPFDLAILPYHQWRSGTGGEARVLGVPTHITPEGISEMRERLRDEGFGDQPVIGLLFGGNDKRYRWTERMAQKVLDGLLAAARAHSCGFAVATSRRTPPEITALIRSRCQENPACIYAAFADDPTPKPEPVQTVFALSTWITVTVDSFSMACEAVSTGKPVVLVEIPPRHRDRYDGAFDAIAVATGMARANLDTLPTTATAFSANLPSARPLRDAISAANAIRGLLGLSTLRPSLPSPFAGE